MQCPTNASAKPNTVITDLQVTFSATPDDDPYKSSYAYRAAVTHSDITEDMSATIVFNDAQASSGNYAPFCVTYDGGIYIYAKVNTTITIPTIKVNGVISYFNLQGTVGSDTKPVKIVDGQAVAVTDFLVNVSGNQEITGFKTYLTSNGNVCEIRDSRKTKGTAPSNDTHTMIYFNDKNNANIGQFGHATFPSGAVRMQMLLSKDSSNEVRLNLQVDADNRVLVAVDGTQRGTYFWQEIFNRA